jgi:murein DD-endopeptidase MepM/ murein hydrolase activator NlpD
MKLGRPSPGSPLLMLVTCAALLASGHLAGATPDEPAGARPSPYRLPWPEGVSRLCIQGNQGIVSHKGRGRYSFDFVMPVGAPVCAARAGLVVTVEVSHAGRGNRAPNNKIGVRHDDGTLAWYLHLKQGGARVRVGESVRQGQVIAASGNVGRSLLPHLHFHVSDGAGATLPIRFSDVDRDGGLPRMLRRYRSGNAPSP